MKSATPKKSATNRPARKAARRSTAYVAKLRKSIIAGLKVGKPAEALAMQLGISRPHHYKLKTTG